VLHRRLLKDKDVPQAYGDSAFAALVMARLALPLAPLLYILQGHRSG